MPPSPNILSLDSLDAARPCLHRWHLRDRERGYRNLCQLAAVLAPEAFRELTHALGRILPRCPDPDLGLNNLERFLTDPRGQAQLPCLLEPRTRTLETLVQLFSSSQFFSDLLVVNPDYLEMLRIPLRSSPSRAELTAQLQEEVDATFEDSAVLRTFRRFRQRHTLRIGANDLVRERPLEEITRDISRVADVSLEVALKVALRHISRRFGDPMTASGTPARCTILAFGKHGGKELNYSSDIDLMFLYDEEGQTAGRRIQSLGNDEFFARVTSEVVRLLSAHTEHGQAYRIDLRLRPEGHRGALARSLPSTLAYYDTLGRTWERQALIKLRPVAGDKRLGEEFLKAIEPFVYRKYLSLAEINEIKALKRQIEHRTRRQGEAETDVKTGRGGIRDVEFTIQFLQLLNGGDLPEVRQRNTLKALQYLEAVGCLTDQEYHILYRNYRFLRQTEHRIQLMFDLQTHRLPERELERQRLALSLGFGQSIAEADFALQEQARDCAVNEFLAFYRECTDLNRKILDHLLHDAFAEGDNPDVPEADLILDPHPDPHTIQAVLNRYGFKDVPRAYHNLTELARESVPFLSTRRCRHFLASIAPHLLQAVAETPDPDMALVNLEKVSASLGGKGVLWELFSFSPPALKLYVDLCAWSQFLSDILINNPGMIDDLLDSLVLNQPRTDDELRQELSELCRGAEDPDLILHSFQDKELLRIGVRDILGKDSLAETTSALSDLAEVILAQIAGLQLEPVRRRFGMTSLASGPRAGQPARFVVLGLGKLGGREMSYHSDLDLIMLYEGDGWTLPPPGASRFERFESTEHFHYFTELGQRIIKATSLLGPHGRLYQVDMRLRPTGKSGSLVTPLAEFERYYNSNQAQLWERQALTRTRVVFGDADFGCEVMAAVETAAYGVPWQPAMVDEIATMRERVQASGSDRDLKRGFGGIIDVEFLVQLFRLKYGRDISALRTTNTWEGLEVCRTAGLLDVEVFSRLWSSYEFLRLVESRLRIVHNRSLDELPDKPEDLEKLARRLGFDQAPAAHESASQRFLEALDRHLKQTRELFVRLVERERGR
jgi:glutamate-ammonia-ligase adenylyltransferase